MFLKNKKGQTTVEYIVTTVMLFAVLSMFYVFYRKMVPIEYEQGAKVILNVYEVK